MLKSVTCWYWQFCISTMIISDRRYDIGSRNVSVAFANLHYSESGRPYRITVSTLVDSMHLLDNNQTTTSSDDGTMNGDDMA